MRNLLMLMILFVIVMFFWINYGDSVSITGEQPIADSHLLAVKNLGEQVERLIQITNRVNELDEKLKDREREIDMLWSALEQAGLARRPETEASNNGVTESNDG